MKLTEKCLEAIEAMVRQLEPQMAVAGVTPFAQSSSCWGCGNSCENGCSNSCSTSCGGQYC